MFETNLKLDPTLRFNPRIKMVPHSPHICDHVSNLKQAFRGITSRNQDMGPFGAIDENILNFTFVEDVVFHQVGELVQNDQPVS